MKISFIAAAAAALALLSSGCSDNNPVAALTTTALAPQGHNVYLRGEMNDYAVLSSYLMTLQKAGAYCTLAPLRADWAPYRFKFADKDWSAGSNFGFATPPGILREGSAPVELNPNSRFEELRFYPKKDGIYRFCINLDDDGRYFVTVRAAKDDELSLIDTIFLQREQSSILDEGYVPDEPDGMGEPPEPPEDED